MQRWLDLIYKAQEVKRKCVDYGIWLLGYVSKFIWYSNGTFLKYKASMNFLGNVCLSGNKQKSLELLLKLIVSAIVKNIMEQFYWNWIY